jgi:Xaa-Pro aminopeptidase
MIEDLGLAQGRIGFEDQAVSYAQYGEWQAAFPRAAWIPASQIPRELRCVKTPEEMEYIREAGKVSDEAMGAAVQALRNGKRECDAMAAAEGVMRDYGMVVGYEPTVGAGPRSGMTRRFPRTTVPKQGEAVRMDFAARYSFAAGFGYHTDITRTVAIGEPDETLRRQLDLILAVYLKTMEGIRPGRKISEVSQDALALVEGTEFEGTCVMAGHALGVEIGEWPPFNEMVDVELQTGMVLAVEPYIVLPTGVGTCIEDTLIVTDTGIEYVTKLERQLW